MIQRAKGQITNKNSLIRKKKGLARSRKVFSTINKKKAFITYHAILCYIDFKGNKNRILTNIGNIFGCRDFGHFFR